MGGLDAAFRGVSYACHQALGGPTEILLRRVGASAFVATPATAYRESVETRATANDRESTFTRRALLLPDAAPVPKGSLFTVDGLTYTVDHVSLNRHGAQTLRGVRSTADTVQRPHYYGRD